MITKGIIEEIINTYQARIRIPMYDGLENTKQSTLNKDLSIASISVISNLHNPVNVGDIVFVGFEDNDIGKPIILGTLYKEVMETKTNLKLNSLISDNLNILNSTILPYNTQIGSITNKEIASLSGIKNNIQEQINELENKINNIINGA